MIASQFFDKLLGTNQETRKPFGELQKIQNLRKKPKMLQTMFNFFTKILAARTKIKALLMTWTVAKYVKSFEHFVMKPKFSITMVIDGI